MNRLTLHGQTRQLPGKVVFGAPRGSVLKIETPGGGAGARRKLESRNWKLENRKSKLEIRAWKLSRLPALILEFRPSSFDFRVLREETRWNRLIDATS
jgi:hypothetical protein